MHPKASWPCMVLTLTVFIIYWPGLDGTFVFDDFPNLSPLGKNGRVDTLSEVYSFLSSGIAGPTGRPISLATFLLNSNTWPPPSGPTAFILTNIGIHALNATLVFILFSLIVKEREDVFANRKIAKLCALFGALLWASHPLWTTTTLYIIQRMTLLSATFSLMGMIFYIHQIASKRPERVIIITALVFTTLATLAKENGAVLPILLMVIWRYIFKPTHTPKNRPAHQRVFMLIFCIVAMGILYSGIKAYISPPETRSFTVTERLLTQPRSLSNYLYSLLHPSASGSSLYHDDFTTSTSLLTPATTPICLILIILAFTSAMRFTTGKWGWTSLATMFFLAGHLIESSAIMLELYFEHRNYLPSVFIFLAVPALLFTSITRYSLAITICVALSGTYSVLTWFKAELWGNPPALFTVWAAEQPNSIRAQVSAVSNLLRIGLWRDAVQLSATAQERIPNSIAIDILHITTIATAADVSKDDINAVNRKILTGPVDFRATRMIEPTVLGMYDNELPGLTFQQMESVINAFTDRSEYADNRNLFANLIFWRGITKIRSQGTEAAQADLMTSFMLSKNVHTVFRGAALLAAQEEHPTAIELLDMYLAKSKEDEQYSNADHREAERLLNLLHFDCGVRCQQRSR